MDRETIESREGFKKSYEEFVDTVSMQLLERLQKYPLTVLVFGAASPRISKRKKKTAFAVGRLLGRKGHLLLYGAGSEGVMGEVARGYLSTNPPIKPIGTTTKFIRQIEGTFPEGTIHCIETRTMAERKEAYLMADVVLVMPGGEGTLDELSEFKCYAQLNAMAEAQGLPPAHWNGPLLLFKQGMYQQYINMWESQTKQNLAPPWQDSVTLVDFNDLENFL